MRAIEGLFQLVIALVLGLSLPLAAQPRADPALPPFALSGTEVLQVPAAALGRMYEVYVALPRGYATSGKRYPVLYVTDANYAFPLIRSIATRVDDHGVGLEDFILVGLSYAVGEHGASSRNRDYTSTRGGTNREDTYGQADAYLNYLRKEVLPTVEKRYRIDATRRIYVGHSYGAMLGIRVLLTQPELFSHYILGSPSLWYDDHQAFAAEREYAARHKAMPARVRMYVGGYEQPKRGAPRRTRERDLVADMERFVKQVKGHHYQGLDLQGSVVPDEDHATVFPVLVTRGLMWALPAARSREGG